MTNRQTRNVSLTPELDRFIEEQLAAGEYGNASEVVRTAIKLLRDRDAPVAGGEAWLYGRGECAELIRAHNWAATTLGPPRTWSAELRTTVNNIVNSPVPKVLMWGSDHIMIYNDGYIAVAGGYHPQALGGTVPEIWPEIWDFNREILDASFRGEIVSRRDQSMTVRRNGADEDVTFDLYYTPVREADGRIGGVMCTVVENTEKIEAERRLARSEAELRTITDALPILIAFVEPDYVYRFANSYYEDWLGFKPSEIIGRHVREIFSEDYFVARRPLMDRALMGETVQFDASIPHRDGSGKAADIRYIPRIEIDGSVSGFHVLVFDVSERYERETALNRTIEHRHRAEAQLRLLNETLEARVAHEISVRRQAEAGLAQSQKMETIGKLTGGVAHDFNNLLQVVSGNLQMLAKDVAGNGRAEQRVSNAMAGVLRGAKLASQLLAFGRRQALEPKVVNATRFVRDMDDMLRRAIGEGIEVETIVGGGLWNSFIDPAQIENALLNLAINARDAMDGHGKLTIELGNASLDGDYARSHSEVVPGQYVMLAVSDTGCGMSPEVIDKVFEPFFSTKGEGKGSGLGLSMVYGFVKQSGGHVKIYSEVGEGTTVKLYLPRADAPEDLEVDIDHGPAAGGTETVLVVEDDDEVRATVVEMLGDLGYRVLKSVDATSALSVIESGIPIDILFTDVVMPGRLKSPELARMARERLPDLAVLFTSGYTENSIVHGGKLDVGVELLSKPYSREALARKFRQVLASQQHRNHLRVVEAAQSASAIPAPGFRRSQEPLNILLVEDDELIRSITAEMLSGGMTVLTAASAEDAVTALQTAPIDVLVTDINLPGQTGLELATRARALRPNIGIVFATGDSEVAFARDDPTIIVLHKPFSASALSASIETAVARTLVRDQVEPSETLASDDSPKPSKAID